MRVILLLVLLGLVGGAAWAWGPGRSQAVEQWQEERVQVEAAAVGIKRMLLSHASHPFERVVVGRLLDGGHVDFRGQMLRDKRLVASYGIARPICADPFESGCWSLTYLEAEGRLVALAGDEARLAPVRPAHVEVSAPVEGAAKLETPEPKVEIAAVVTPDAPAEPIVQPAEPEPVQEQAEEDAEAKVLVVAEAEPAPPPATHLVARPVINTRAGPGTNNPVMTRLKAGDRLALLGTEGGWGNFLILDGDDGGVEVWAALRLLEDAK